MKKIILIASIFITVIVAGYLYYSFFIFQTPGVSNVATDANRPATDNHSGYALIFSQDEVAKHSTPNDCYLIINNNVYDVSSYIASHPGGGEAITSRCGHEVTDMFAKIHSNRAWDLLAGYKIGALQ